MRLHRLRTLPIALIAAAIAGWSCADTDSGDVTSKIDPEKVATMVTTNVSTLISDSGVIRYHITSPLWLVFDEAREPHWRFPNGLYLEKYSDLSIPEASITADSARYFKNKQLWRLDGYVEITNTVGERFLSPQLFWDQKQQKVYSDSFIHIERADRIIEGYGFVSNDHMTRYEVLNVSGIFPSEQFRPGEQNTAAAPAADTTRLIRSKAQRKPGTHIDANGVERVIIPSNRKEVEAREKKEAQKEKKNLMKTPLGNIPTASPDGNNLLLRPRQLKK